MVNLQTEKKRPTKTVRRILGSFDSCILGDIALAYSCRCRHFVVFVIDACASSRFAFSHVRAVIVFFLIASLFFCYFVCLIKAEGVSLWCNG